MATLHKEIHIEARPEAIWDAARDLGALHTRLVPGFVVDTQLEGTARIVTFGNGMVVRELIISVDDQGRRLAGQRSAGVPRTTTRSWKCLPTVLARASSGPPISCRTRWRSRSRGCRR